MRTNVAFLSRRPSWLLDAQLWPDSLQITSFLEWSLSHVIPFSVVSRLRRFSGGLPAQSVRALEIKAPVVTANLQLRIWRPSAHVWPTRTLDKYYPPSPLVRKIIIYRVWVDRYFPHGSSTPGIALIRILLLVSPVGEACVTCMRMSMRSCTLHMVLVEEGRSEVVWGCDTEMVLSLNP
jgi:hypothetical protein